MRELAREFIKFFVSLKLTVALLALSALLVFLATIDQVHLGIWAVQEKWFKSLIVSQVLGVDMTPTWYAGYFACVLLALGAVRLIGWRNTTVRELLCLPAFITFVALLTGIWGLHALSGIHIPVPIFPGGYFIGGLLLINLVAAHIKRFSFTWKKAGIQLVHGGLILLLLGELFTGLFQQEYQLRLDEGQTKNYSESWRRNELAVIDTTSANEDIATVIPEARLQRVGASVQSPALPFRLVVRDYFPNATLTMREEAPAAGGGTPNLATAGLGPRVAVTPLPITYRHDQRNLPAAFVELIGPEGSLGTFLFSTMLVEPERITYAGREWALNFRFERAYKPYSLTLIEFTHDRYAGTEIPKNFSSRVRLRSQDGTDDREALIFMNNPLRYDGMTFYQAGFDNNDRTTILQVVRNPSWVIPYLSCLLMSVGLYWQFGWHLVRYSAGRGRSGPPKISDHSMSLGLVLGLRLMAGLVALWAASSGQGTAAVVALGVVAVEFVVCATLLGGLVAGRPWVRSLHIAYAWAAVLLLGAVTAYGFLGGDIYDAILRWVVIGVHALTAAALLALVRRPAAVK